MTDLARAVTWVDENHQRNDFAASLFRGLARYGSLTPNQVAAVCRILDREATRTKREVTVTDEGIYSIGLDEPVVFKVKRSGAGNLYALRLDPTSGEFVYEKGSIFTLRLPTGGASRSA